MVKDRLWTLGILNSNLKNGLGIILLTGENSKFTENDFTMKDQEEGLEVRNGLDEVVNGSFLLAQAMIQPFHITNGLFGYVDGTILCPEPLITSPGKEGTSATPTTNPSHTIWISNDAHVRMLLMSTISEASFQHVQGTTSRDLWLALERAYAPHTSSREFTLKTQLLKTQMTGDETSAAYLTRAQEYASALANIGQPMSEKDIVMLVVAGLRDEYNRVKQSLLARQFTAVFSELPGLLADHEFLIRKPVPDVTPVQAFMATTTAGSSLQTDIQALQQLVSRLAVAEEASIPVAVDVVGMKEVIEIKPSANYADTRSHASTSWLPDTGSNNHVAPDMMGFDSVESYYGDDNLHVGNGNALPILHIGSSRLYSPNKTFHLNNILHVPQIKKHLLSVQNFCKDNHVYFEFHATFFVVKDTSTHSTLLTGPSDGGLYSINLPTSQSLPKVAFSTTRTTTTTWHQRLGHPHSQLFQTMLSKYCLPVSNKTFDFHCNSCSVGKSSKLNLLSSDYKSSHILDLVFCDVWGPAPVTSFDGHTYFLLCVDHFSKFMWLFPLKRKSDVVDVFKRFVSMAERQFSTKLKTVQTDWGGEFRNLSHFFLLLASFTVSLALTPANKMVSLRDAIVMLSKLDSLPWHNLMSLNGSGTLLLKPHTAHHGYRCFDPDTERIYIARHVRFNENSFPFSTPCTDPSPFPPNSPYVSSYPTPIPTTHTTIPTSSSPTSSSQPHIPLQTPFPQPTSPFSTTTYSRRTTTEPPTTTSSAFDRFTTTQTAPTQSIPSPNSTDPLPAQQQPSSTSTTIPPSQPSRPAHLRQNPKRTKRYDPSAMSVQPPQDNNFYMDTGASRHMTFNQGTMHSLTPCNSSFIQVGNGAVVPARYIGQCKLPFSPWPLMLKNVLVSDKLIKNLISVRRFTIDNSVSVEFDPFGFTVKDLKTGSFLQRCDSDHHDLYPVLPPSPQSAVASANVAVSFDVWHRRLGHPGAAVFQFLLSRKFIACSSQNSSLCHACQLGKHCRLPFSLSSTKTSCVFKLIHSDLWTSPVISLSGFKYYVLFLDDYSHFLWVFPLRAKSEVFSVFKTFRAYVLNQFITDIQLFQCDNGREFNNQPFLDFFKTHGIKIRFSCPYTSPQNGKAERTIRTINNTLRTSLIQASLPPKFWVEALLSSVHTFNLLPSTTIQYKTSFEVLFGFFPTYSHLRVFGCLCYPNTSPTSAHKLAPRSSACVYLGPSTDHRGYHCLDLITQKVIISRHVNFDETHFPFPDFQPRPSSEDYDAFDVDDSLPSLSPMVDSSSPSSAAGPSASVSSSQTPPTEPSGTASSPPASSEVPSQPPAPAATSGHPMTTRSRTGSLKPKQIFNLSVTSDISPIPRSTAQAMCDPHWRAAMDAEMTAILSNYTWDLVPKPSDANIVGNRWLFRHKFDSNGRLERYKARLVAQGFSQQPGLDFDDTFSPVVKPATIRTVLSISISRNWPIHQLDVKNAFLHGDLTETVYMRQPPGYVNSSFPDHVCRLRKALYGLKQAPRAWYHRFAVYLSSLGFLSSKIDTSLFTYHRGSDTIYLLLYVDDIILTASSPTLISMVISKLSSEFPMSDLGPLSFFLGIAPSRSKSGLFLSQSAFAQEILARADMVSFNPCSTPADTQTKLAIDGEPVPDPTLYRSLAGALQYLTFTRPDIAYAVQQVCLFMHDPRLPHLNALKRILRYLKGTLSYGLHIKASAVDRLVAYSDAGCPTTRRSTSGFCVYLGDNLVSWSSKRHHVVSRSSAEAEYRGIANVVAETAWLRNLLLELCCPLSRATVVFCDNVSAMYLASNPVQHQRTKHVEIDLHFVRERVAIGHVRVLHVPSAYQYADIFTKGLPTSLFLDFRNSLNICLPPDQTTGVC
ncbi:hypothetical protein OSB04_003454 [Centaurea solstitialis]|uniref:Integrase catalytic domain-containing protein n=1 Tax=Centaurea solstitialis TaxID=347529 RepID=A0AA38UCJ7_9ASTR|nr:hypothetical protein OSB04_003454 [Centaurea solstitialis]